MTCWAIRQKAKKRCANCTGDCDYKEPIDWTRIQKQAREIREEMPDHEGEPAPATVRAVRDMVEGEIIRADARPPKGEVIEIPEDIWDDDED